MLKLVKSDLLFSKGQKLARKGRYAEAVPLFEQAARQNPKSGGILLHMGLVQSADGQYKEAVKSIGRAIQLKPANPAYHAFLGLVHLDYRHYPEAIDAFDAALKIEPDYSLPIFLKALTRFSQGNVEAAYPDLARHGNNLGSSYQARLLFECESYILAHRKPSENPKQTTMFFEESSVGHPRTAFHRSLLQLGYGLAISLSLLNLDRVDAAARQHKLRGNLMFRLGDTDATINEYKKALAIDDTFYQAHEKLVEVYYESRGFEQALSHAVILDEDERRRWKKTRSAKEKSPRSSYSLVLGALNFYLSRYDAAEPYLNEAAKNDPYHYLPYYFLGVCRLIRNDRHAALSHFEKAVSLINPKLVTSRLETAHTLLIDEKP